MEFKGENLQKALKKFGKKTVEVAAANLVRSKRGVDTGKLLKSIDYDLAVTLNAFSLKFKYLDYGEAIDKGRGKANTSQGGVVYRNILEWVKRKRLRPRNSRGQFEAWRNKTQQQKSIAFLVARKINRFGYKGNGFFTNAFKQTYKKLPKDIKTAYMLDFDKFMKFTLDEIQNGNNGN
jgi:hypothetical protein|tara:strand:+ start:1725 stop:2258 length:534 start_codon:yes stop_codon:yes gene_type:complete